ncbi:MAG TPA: dihydrolipoamide acetyltransferase family protein [Myxococcota bacterium]|nr:dihydrolipoamide acetyltransferase family protein [Myxococcota bacterium]
MPKQIRMPKLSDTMEEGRLIAWRKKVGDPVKRGEVLAEIETDKADMEFEAYTEGTLAQIVVDAGATVPVGTLIAVLRLPGESEEAVTAAPAPQTQAPAAPKPAAAPAARPAAAPAAAPRPAAAASRPAPAAEPAPVALPPAPAGERIAPIFAPHDDRIRATPRARRIAEEKSIDLSEVTGTGPSGAILASDLEGYLGQLEVQPPDADGVRATPLALKMASEQGTDLEAVKGSGPGGRITKSDLLAHWKREKAHSKEREAVMYRGTLQLSQKRKALIRNMVRSKAEAPHFYIQMDVATEALRELRDQLNREAGDKRPRLTYTHLMLKAAALALERHPHVNATYRPEENDIALYDAINVGLAVDVQDELVAPTVKDCQGRTVWQLAEEANSLIQRARMRKLQPADYADGTFTISNLGMFGVDRFYAIITPPQSSILSVSSITDRPVVREGRIEIGSITTLGLSVDHRVIDGVRAAQFLAEIKRLLEQPRELAQDGSALSH